MTGSSYVGRFAPSPSGPLHLGSLLAAVASFLDSRANEGLWLVRIEDIDPPREPAGAADEILTQLHHFGLTWDGEVLYQSQRLDSSVCSHRPEATSQTRTVASSDPDTILLPSCLKLTEVTLSV